MIPSPAPSTVRAFVAILLPPSILQGLEDLAATLKSRLPGKAMRWNPPHQIHLTLHFLGNIPAQSIPQLRDSLAGTCASFPPVALTARDLGTFPHAQRPRVLWVGLDGTLDGLLQLQRAVRLACQPWNHDQDRPFKPHLTLARCNQPDRPTVQALNSLLAELDSPVFGSWIANEVTLMRSELTSHGAVHSPLDSWKLGT